MADEYFVPVVLGLFFFRFDLVDLEFFEAPDLFERSEVLDENEGFAFRDRSLLDDFEETISKAGALYS